MNLSAGPPVELLHDHQEKGSLAFGAVAHRSTPGAIARSGRMDTRAQAEAPSARKSDTPEYLVDRSYGWAPGCFGPAIGVARSARGGRALPGPLADPADAAVSTGG
jgi:hypothetical protein